MAVIVVEKDMRQCEAVCPKHGAKCKLKMFEQNAFPMHAHTIDQKTCVWKNELLTAYVLPNRFFA